MGGGTGEDRKTFAEDLVYGGVSGKIYASRLSDSYFYKVTGISFGVNSNTGVQEFIVKAVGLRRDGSYQKPAGAVTDHSLQDCFEDPRVPADFAVANRYWRYTSQLEELAQETH